MIHIAIQKIDDGDQLHVSTYHTIIDKTIATAIMYGRFIAEQSSSLAEANCTIIRDKGKLFAISSRRKEIWCWLGPKKDDDRDEEADYCHFHGIEKGAVMQEVITKLLFMIIQGETFTKVEPTERFFAVTKLFQSKDTGLRRIVYLITKELSPSFDEIIIVTSSLIKDLNNNTALHRANAIRPVVASAALVNRIHLLQTTPDIVKCWSGEVQKVVQSQAALLQFHALALLQQVGLHN
ncbi:hypothetical protein SUGI_0005150 [Cryptomeria japonica]|nr:hypothetical protein SUGI_0005150 [Cryptomeria japonica]